MADKKPTQRKESAPAKSPPDKTGTPAVTEPKKKSGCLLYLIIFCLLTVVLLVSAVAAANYLGAINLQELKEDLGQKYQLQSYPVIGNYFSPVETNFELAPTQEEASQGQEGAQTAPPGGTPPPVLPQAQQANTLTPEDVAREEKRKQDELTQRASRLARLYGEMKPAAAAEVMNEIDDEMILTIFARMEDRQVAKILALFEAERAARLTEDMLRGQ